MTTFQSNAATVLNWDLNHSPPIAAFLQKSLDDFLKMDLPELFHNSSDMIKKFNEQFYCIKKINKIIAKFQKTPQWKTSYEQKMEAWGEAISQNLMDGKFPKNINRYFGLRDTLASQLISMSEDSLLFDSLYEEYPVLNNSPYDFKKINALIEAVVITDHKAVAALVRKINTLFMFLNLFKFLANPHHPLNNYHELWDKHHRQFEALINQNLMDSRVMEKAEQLFKNLCALDKLEQFIARVHVHNKFPAIEQALIQLMPEDNMLVKLNNLLRKGGIHTQYFEKLNRGLAALESASPQSEDLNQRCFAEIARYYASPKIYLPYSPPVAGSSSSLGIFAVTTTSANPLEEADEQSAKRIQAS
jgi:hypothetical protein